MGLGLVWRWAGKMRLELRELAMLIMLSRELRSCADGFARGVAKLASFSPSGVAFLYADPAMLSVGLLRAAQCSRLERAC